MITPFPIPPLYSSIFHFLYSLISPTIFVFFPLEHHLWPGNFQLSTRFLPNRKFKLSAVNNGEVQIALCLNLSTD